MIERNMNAKRFHQLLRTLCVGLAFVSANSALGQETEGPSPTEPPTATNPPTATDPVEEALEVLANDDVVVDTATLPITATPDALVAPEATGESFEYAQAWQALMDSEEYDEAAVLATTWVTDATVQYGKRSLETFVPFVRLADAYAANKLTAQAAKAYADAILVGERRLGAFSPSLVEPLLGLGTMLARDRQHESAISALRRAKDITHRNKGIYNIEQSPIVDKLTISYAKLGEFRQATREQQLLFGSAAKEVGEDSVEFVPALQKWANWNAQLQRYSDARKYFNRAVELLEEEYGPNDVRIIETLNMIANSFRRNVYANFPREGSRALRQVVDIYKAQDVVDQTDLLRAYTRLGDWYMLSGRGNRGVEVYAQGIREAREAGVSDEVINAGFAIPRPLTKNSLPVGMSIVDQARVENANSAITLEFDVARNGRPHNIRVVQDTVQKLGVVKLLKMRLANARFRPRFVDGKAVAHRGVRYIYEF